MAEVSLHPELAHDERLQVTLHRDCHDLIESGAAVLDIPMAKGGDSPSQRAAEAASSGARYMPAGMSIRFSGVAA